MPTKSLPRAEAGVGIHGFAARAKASRGWRAFARHDGVGITDGVAVPDSLFDPLTEGDAPFAPWNAG
jgi:hypothetical protein